MSLACQTRSLALVALLGACVGGRSPGGPGAGTGSDGGTGGPVSYPAGSFGAACHGSPTALTGTAWAPNGMDPVAAAHVYVVDKLAPFPQGVSCDVCDHPIDTALASTIAGADGRFSLPLDTLPKTGSVQLVVAKGRFRHVATVAVTACASAPAPHAATTLPGRRADGDLPRIAVATGSSDHLDVVLDALGIQEFDCYLGAKGARSGASGTPCASATTDVETLLGDPAKLASYDMLFLSCAPGKFASLANPSTVAKDLAAWTQAGGRLFATDQSYDYVEQSFPSQIDFYPGTATPMTAQPVAQGNLGVGGTGGTGGASYPGTVVDPALATWLAAVGAVPPEANTLTLTGFLNPWAAQKDVAMGVSTEVTAVASYYTTAATSPGSPATSATMPMTVEFDDNQCGRVLFSSYHTLASTKQGASLSAQEKILEYLVLDVSSCVGPIS